MKNLKLLVLTNNQILITQIEEVSTDLGEPDCKLIEPFILNQSDLSLSPWMVDYSTQNTFMIHSDKILTIADPNGKLKDKYESLVE
jgi:hypothetical protein